MGSIEDNFNLGLLGRKCWPRSLPTYFKRTLVHEKSIQLHKGVVGSSRLSKDNGRDSTTDTIWSISDGDTLDRANRFAEIVL